MLRPTLLGVPVAAALLATVAPATAASPVTFVASSGYDTGICTRTAPCRTFRYALTMTSGGGIVAALDRAGFGTVTINQSVTLAGPGKGGASMSPNPQNGNVGVTIDAPGATVVLRGLEIDGGYDGIYIGNAKYVVISDTVIVGSSNPGIEAGDTGASVLVQVTTVQNADTRTYAASFVAKRVTVASSSSNGISPSAGHPVLDDCTVSGSGTVNVSGFGGTTIIKHGAISSAGLRGINVSPGATAYVDRTTTFGNGLGISNGGALVSSYGNNNFPDGTVTPTSGD